MSLLDSEVLHLATANSVPLHSIESIFLRHVDSIEAWFAQKWQETPPLITVSVDLRQAGFKIAPVDTNVFPAGFNNIHDELLPLCVKAAKSVLDNNTLKNNKLLLLPENHTRNLFYLQSLAVLRDIFIKAGFVVRIGSLDPTVSTSFELEANNGEVLLIEPLLRQDDRIVLEDFDPYFLLLNNDLSSGVPDVLLGLQQNIQPPVQMGWSSRLKSTHFQCFAEVAQEFSALINMDPWLINPLFTAVDGVDFMTHAGIEAAALAVDNLLGEIREKYTLHNIQEKPFVVVKADNGTYGMGVMMVHSGAQLLQLNRKQRTSMSATKGSRKLSRLLIQEGVYSIETMADGSVAEPVVYMIGSSVVGGFYRVHQGRGVDESLNAPGMHFEPLTYAKSDNSQNRFYAYGVIARLAALAAAYEMTVMGDI